MSAKLIAFYKKNRLTIAYFIMTLVLAAPYLDLLYPALALREKLLSAIPLFLLFLFNDWRTESDDRLKKIEQGLNDPEPPTYRRFPAMEEDMASVMNELVAKGGPITVKVIGVSTKFSRPFLQRIIVDLLESNQPRALDIEISIVLTEPVRLKDWQLEDWGRSSEHSIDEIRDFLRKHKKKMGESGIRLCLAQYDNLPHWHGVMFNERILFMGRTEWYRDGDDANWQLRVGEVEYRKFENDDSYGGKKRIDRFARWHQRYLERAKHNKKVDCIEDAPPQANT